MGMGMGMSYSPRGREGRPAAAGPDQVGASGRACVRVRDKPELVRACVCVRERKPWWCVNSE